MKYKELTSKYRENVLCMQKKLSKLYGVQDDYFITSFNPGVIVDYKKDNDLGILYSQIEIVVKQNINKITGKGGWVPGDIIGSYKNHQFIVQDLPIQDGYNYKYNIIQIDSEDILNSSVLDIGIEYIKIGVAYSM